MTDFAAKLAQARQKLPLKLLMEQYGRGPANGNWKAFPKCPYCAKDSAGVFEGKHGDLFKCHHSDCPSGTQHDKGAWDEIAFLSYELKLNRKDAAIAWLRQAGILKQTNLPRSGPSSVSAGSTEPKQGHVIECSETNHPGPITAESWPSEGAAAVPPTSSPFADGVNASSTGSSPSPEPSGEVSLSPAAAGAGESEANPTSSAPPTISPKGPLAALRAFYERLTLLPDDAEMLWKKRGLTQEICVAVGLVSSPKTNKSILISLRKEFDENVLLAACLWTREDKAGAEAKPNPQYYGWGVSGKDAEGNETFGWTHPILIPYLDAKGELLDLRPHKRTQRGQSPRLYVPRVLKKFRGEFPKASAPRFGVVTESEFKALALFQTLGDSCAIAALPGITMSKPLFGDIEDWLCDLDLKQVVVAFDNEEKGDKRLPGYKAEPWKRYDTEAWARYLAKQLAQEGYDSRVAHLPNAWRDEKGKADWDGALAKLICESRIKGSRSIEVWKKVSGKVRSEFLEVIKAAVRVEEAWQSGIFEPEVEKLIFKQLNKLTSVPNLPSGGDAEAIVARRLRRIYARIKNDSERLPLKAGAFLLHLAKQYDSLKGGYYTLKRLTDANRERWLEYLQEASNHDDVEVKRACEIVLLGIPERISDFTMEALFVVKKPNDTRERLVHIIHRRGLRTDFAILPSNAFSQPSKFREWLMNASSGATWSAGERELNKLQEDVFDETIWKEVIEVPLRGFDDSGPGLRFFGDVIYTPDDKEIFPDRHGIVWFQGKGYRTAAKDQENQTFVQGIPLMRPHMAFTDEQTRELFQEASQKMFETIGHYGGYLALGAILAYGAAKEFFETYTAFAGLWLHGESQQGKSSVARWLLRIWGFLNCRQGTPLPDSSRVGISIAVQQYGDLPVWLEEFQPNLIQKHPWMTEKLKEMYNRERGIKKTFDEVPRRVRTNVIVTGVGTSGDSQLRSRYCHVQVSSQTRIRNHYRWFEKTSLEKFSFLGRYILRHRREFAERMMKQMELWLESKALMGCEERARVVYGASYCAFLALVSMLESHTPEDMKGFREYLHQYVEKSAQEVREQGPLIQFWIDLLAANKEGVFGDTPAQRGEVFKVILDRNAPSPVSEAQRRIGEEDPARAWPSPRLYLLPDSVIARMRQWLKRQGRDLPLDKSDLRAQMKAQDYWVEPSRDSHQQKFNGAKSNQACWCIAVDKHPLGFKAVTDEEFAASFRKEDGMFFASEDWVDPRKGDLFALIESLKPQRKSEE